VFRGDDGLDELTITTTSTVWRVHDGKVAKGSVDPTAHGLELVSVDALRGGDVHHNADVVRRLLAGETGPVRDAVVLNAGAALAVYDAPADPPAEALATGIARAAEAIDSGAAQATLARWVAASSAL
jgi:anthranilate phosphoribosyltransferase